MRQKHLVHPSGPNNWAVIWQDGRAAIFLHGKAWISSRLLMRKRIPWSSWVFSDPPPGPRRWTGPASSWSWKQIHSLSLSRNMAQYLHSWCTMYIIHNSFLKPFLSYLKSYVLFRYFWIFLGCKLTSISFPVHLKLHIPDFPSNILECHILQIRVISFQ